jgi:kynureninase
MNYNDIQACDKNDPLARKRQEFLLPKNLIYLDGNSLGALPVVAQQHAMKVVAQQWGEDLITSWNTHQWIDLPRLAGEKIAKLIGAGVGQVICCDSISVNLFKLLSAALKLQTGRTVILSQQDNFPTDLYIAQGLQQLIGTNSCHLKQVADEDLISHLDESIAVLMLTQVNFRCGKIHDMQRLTKLAQQKGILVIWDLAHSAGAIPVELDDCNVDFAVGCGYKYLNGGPGSPAFVYAAKRHQEALNQPLTGWMGHADPFAFDPLYSADKGVGKFLCGTPPVISLSILNAALDVFADVSVQQLRVKSLELTELFIYLVERTPALKSLNCVSPKNKHQRGSQVAFTHPHAYAICQALIDRGVILDFRAPDILRAGFTPLYTSYSDVWHCVEALTDIVAHQCFLDEKYQAKHKVT